MLPLTPACQVQLLGGLVSYPSICLAVLHIAFRHMLVLSVSRFCGGLIKDLKRKAPFFASDFYDALNIQALSAILFIYLATVTNAITFGGLLGDATDNMQVGTAWGEDTNRAAQIVLLTPGSVGSRWPFCYSA